MTAKEYLQQLRQINTELAIKQEELERLKASVGIRAMPSPDQYAGHSSTPSDPVADIALRIVKREEVLTRRINRLYDLQEKITDQIDGLENRTYRNLLVCKYVLEMTWPQVAETMHYNEDYCKKELHSWALLAFYKKYLRVKDPTESPH